MVKDSLIEIFDRDLKKLVEEISLYKDELLLWKVEEGISNSAGNLCLHLIGNLNHFIGATLGGTDYVRKREEEFSLENVPRVDMIKNIEVVSQIVKTSLTLLPIEKLEKEFPINVFGKPITTELFLIHLATHLSYHLGQINYHRRLVN